MTDRRSTADDLFEGALRATLLASTAPHAPRSLRVAAAAIVARPVRAHHRGWGRFAAPAVAAMLGLAVIGFGLGPVTSILRPAVAPGTSPTAALPTPPASPDSTVPPSVQPSVAPSIAPTPTLPPAYVFKVDQVLLTAEEIVLEIAGERFVVNPDAGGPTSNFVDTPTRWRVPVPLRAGGDTRFIHLILRADASGWWVEHARTYEGPRPIKTATLRGPVVRTPIGEALRGDLVLSGDMDGSPMRVELTGMTLDPVGLGTGPHDWNDCTRFTDLDAATKKTLRDAKRPGRVGAIADRLDLCIVYLWTFGSTEGGHLVEVWCTPPTSGVISSIRAGDSGEAVVTVLDPPRKLAPRPQPVEGWGCEPEPGTSPSARP
jgi:hypothetical protein